MLDDRSYMRETEYRPGLSGTTKLLIVLIAAFALQMIDSVYNGGRVTSPLALRTDDVLHGYVWQLITFQFLHGGPLHIICNGLAVWCFGRTLEAALGRYRMYALFLLSGIAGGLLQVLLGLVMPQWSISTVGASAGTAGFLAAFALMNPDGRILFYFIPVPARALLIISLSLSFFLTIVPADRGVAHPAHLGGLLAGMAMVKWGIPEFSMDWWTSLRDRFRSRHLKVVPKPGSSSWNAESQPPRRARDDDDEEYMKKVVNPILDKISVHGTSSLTDEEKRILNAASARMKKS